MSRPSFSSLMGSPVLYASGIYGVESCTCFIASYLIYQEDEPVINFESDKTYLRPSFFISLSGILFTQKISSGSSGSCDLSNFICNF